MQAFVIIDSGGVIVVPPQFSRQLGLAPDDRLMVETTSEGILIRVPTAPPTSSDIEEYTEQRIAEFASEEALLGRGPTT